MHVFNLEELSTIPLFLVQQVEVDGVQCMLEILDTAGQVIAIHNFCYVHQKGNILNCLWT